MKEKHFLNLACRHCRYYQPEGRRGGSCNKLSVSVESDWKACMLASSPFGDSLGSLDTTLTTLDTALTTLEEIVHLETALSLSYKSYNQEHSTEKKNAKNTLQDDLITNRSRIQ